MSDTIPCLRCQTPMEPGFVADRTYGAALRQQWSPGTPNISFWTGLKMSRNTVPVMTMRCPKCGALESFARPV